jgi:hypothetical protein
VLEVEAAAMFTGMSAQTVLQPRCVVPVGLCPFTHRASRSVCWPGAHVAPPRVQTASRCARRRAHARFPSRYTSSEILLDIRLLLICSLPFPPARASPSPSSAPPALRNHCILPFRGHPCVAGGARHARCKLVKALAAAGLLALSVYTELAFAEGKSALVRPALVEYAVRRHASALRTC